MRKFSVSNVASDERMAGGDINVGIAPGKFDTKQLILSAIAVLATEATDKWVRFVRTINKEELSKCTLFINDDFTTMFPVIPSYHDIEEVWNKNADVILARHYVYDKAGVDCISRCVLEKIGNLEAIDCMMELYDINASDSFEDALNTILKFINKIISDSIKDRMYIETIKSYVENAFSNCIKIPLYISNWRHILSSIPDSEKIEYAVFPDEEDTYVVEAFDKNLCVKKYVKGLKGVVYSGRFFVRVDNIETAEQIVAKLPTKKQISQQTA